MENTTESYYGKYLEPLRDMENDILNIIDILLNDITPDPESAPAEHIRSRIKDSESTKEKLKKLRLPTDVSSALKNLSDIIGIRIVTHFVGDVYKILDALKSTDGCEIVKTKDYISSPKPNGYRSLHVIIRVPFEDEDIPFINIEIQLRTIAMDCWASLEHQLKYKKNISNVKLIEGELKRCADEIASTDLTMQTIRDMIKGE